MEKLYTIPVNESFEKQDGCPFCTLYADLERRETDLILGASMMEPDVRKQTNAQGFCPAHLEKLYAAQKRLPLALILESRLQQVEKQLSPAGISLRDKGEGIADAAQAAASSCYLCERIEFHLSKMFRTAFWLYEADKEFRAKFAAQPFFCMTHYARALRGAKQRLAKSRYAEFLAASRAVEEGFLQRLNADVSKFCQKFDYRFAGEPWGEEKSAIERALLLFGVDVNAHGEKKEP